ncbi:MAG TPA: RNA methyltransferase, partial [Polyangiales bacterium]|nr:RNA methyltransferase [Polyangiales bacterium]
MNKKAARPKAERVYGLSAALAAFAQRPDKVLSIAHTKDARRDVAEMLREAARRRIAYREVDDEALTTMAESVHHEGVCLLLRADPAPSLEDLAARVGAQGLLIALADVQNPHNLGAILRSAAYFGARGIVVSQDKKLTAAARRVAEGGAEHVPIAPVEDLAAALRALADHEFTIIGADTRAKLELGSLRWPKRAVLVLGHERDGLGGPVRAACKSLVRIAGSPAVDSLNVSVAAGVLLASFAQQHGIGA